MELPFQFSQALCSRQYLACTRPAVRKTAVFVAIHRASLVHSSICLYTRPALCIDKLCRHNFNYKYNPKPNPIYYFELSLELLARLKTTPISIGIRLNALRYASLSSIDFKHFKVQVNWRLHRCANRTAFPDISLQQLLLDIQRNRSHDAGFMWQFRQLHNLVARMRGAGYVRPILRLSCE